MTDRQRRKHRRVDRNTYAEEGRREEKWTKEREGGQEGGREEQTDRLTHTVPVC